MAAVRKFQVQASVEPTGVVNDDTFRHLISPMLRACLPLVSTAPTLAERIVAAARQHLRERPRAIGGVNKGPWVRLHAKGRDGSDVDWAAHFVRYVVTQAMDGKTYAREPITAIRTIEDIAQQAMAIGNYVSREDRKRQPPAPGSIFLLRSRSRGTWVHCGVVVQVHDTYIESIEVSPSNIGGNEIVKLYREHPALDEVTFSSE